MPATIIDEYKIFPRLMMLVVTILTYELARSKFGTERPSFDLHGCVNWLLRRLDEQRSKD
jgi:hypothetical protein